MATSLIGPLLVDSALAAAPVPRPPQPTSASWIVWFSPACTAGMATPVRADAATSAPGVFQKLTARRTCLLGDVHGILLGGRASEVRSPKSRRAWFFALTLASVIFPLRCRRINDLLTAAGWNASSEDLASSRTCKLVGSHGIISP